VVDIEIEPQPAGTGFVFENKVVGGTVPRQFIPAVEAGLREALGRGVLAQQPLVDIKVALVDGKAHEVDSSERAFHTAASMALRKAVSQANPILLEPIMRVEVITPDDYLGEVIGDLSARSASILGIEMRPGAVQSIRAYLPLASMFGYATALRSRTQGRGTFVMEFDHHAPIALETVKEREQR
jgi:elongation factor G